MMTDAEIERQLPQRFNPFVNVTIVIAAAPIVLTKPTELAKLLADHQTKRWDYDNEDWGFNHWCFERLLARLATRTASWPGAALVVVLGGDVHHGYTIKIQYEGDRPFGYSSAGESRMIVANLVASGFKNEDWMTRGLHNFPHSRSERRLAASVLIPGPVVGPSAVASYLHNWIQGRTNVRVGLVDAVGPWPRDDPHVSRLGRGARYDLSYFAYIPEPLPLPSVPAPTRVDWRYRSDLIEVTRDRRAQPIPRIPRRADRNDAIQWLRDVTVEERRYLREVEHGSMIVGRNNVGEVRFPHWPANKSKISHTLWWSLDGRDALPLSTYEVNMLWLTGEHDPLPTVQNGKLHFDRSTL